MKAELERISIQNRMQYFQWTGEAIGELFAMKAVGLPPAVVDYERRPTHVDANASALSSNATPPTRTLRYRGSIRTESRAVLGESTEKGKGCVMMDRGDRSEAVVVLAADGLHSPSQDVVLGGQGSGKPSGQSLFRCAVPFEKVMHDPMVKKQLGLGGGKPMMRAFVGPCTHCMVLTYVDQESANGMIAWGLNYYAGRILQIGDAAHSCIPTSGNGATQAIEDAVTIAECLRPCASPGCSTDVPLAVKTHNLLRYDRLSCAQLLGFVNQHRYHDTDFEVPVGDVGKVTAKVPKWIWTHDPENYAFKTYSAAASSLRDDVGMVFENTNFLVGHECRDWKLEVLSSSR